MKWWHKAILISIAWVILSKVAFLIHVNIIGRGLITTHQYSAFNKGYSYLAGIGLIPIWTILLFASLKRRE
ncbi:MAG: hypothetical protein KJ584_05260 [Candidatus Omnitrophica bacterium]|nr:hypothetical protein [Candidatus Omnitrophota bacterium]